MKLLSRLASLPAPKRRLLVAALGWIVFVRLALPCMSLASLHALLSRRRQPVLAPSFTPREGAWAVQAVASRIPGNPCLVRALALHAMLFRAGFDSQLRLGVAHAPGGIAAHAWVSCGADSFGAGPEHGSFAPFGALPR